MFYDMKDLSVEDLVGRLRVAEDRFDEKVDHITDRIGKLLLTEEWFEKHKNRSQSSGSPMKKEWGGASSHGKGKAVARQEPQKGGVKLSSEGTSRQKGRCHNCGIYGHWAEDCKRPKKQKKEEKKEEANLAKVDVDVGTLLMAIVHEIKPMQSQLVHLQEKKVKPIQCEDGVWHLDIGATNHLTGMRSVLSNLDLTVQGSVKFGDGSIVSIEGLGSMIMTGKNGEHKVLTNVYYIPKLQSNIISLGQLEEAGCKIEMEDGWLQVFDRVDQGRRLIVRTPRTENRLYKLHIRPTTPVVLMLNITDTTWLWHARYGHLNFRALRELGRRGMANGIPVVDHVEQVCEGCTLGKQHRSAFPKSSYYRAQKGLELFHIDLCGQITPTTPGGKAYFLLVVDDYTRYMWIELLRSKDEALACLKKVKARAETKLEGKLKAIRTDKEVSLTQGNSQCSAQSLGSSISPILHILHSRMEQQRGGIRLLQRWLDAL